MNKSDIRNLTMSSLFLLLAGILLPCMTVFPQAGEFTGFLSLLAPDEFKPTSYSILSGILEMFKSGAVGTGLLLFVFSILFPFWKLSTFLFMLVRRKSNSGKSMKLAQVLGKYSMLDVFVLAVLVVAIKGLPGGSRVELESGISFFAVSVLMSLFVGQKIGKFVSSQQSLNPED
jgi:paraquat-inducible protein A